VVIPPAQGCCGAVTHHQGELEQTRALAEELISRFEAVIGEGRPAGPEPLEAVLVAASGCGHTLKAYDHLLGEADSGAARDAGCARPPATPDPAGGVATSGSEPTDPEPAIAARDAASRASRFATSVADIQEFLARVGLSESFRASLQPLRHADGTAASAERPLVLAYHDACHMIHGQGISRQPRDLLRQIPHVRLVEAMEAGVCCGSAGIYNLVQPEEAAELGRLKASDLAGTGASIAVSANIGCSLQIRRHLAESDTPLPVEHPVQLLLRSFQGG
jgi:glycolate oxidase iron-sulfur subunit